MKHHSFKPPPISKCVGILLCCAALAAASDSDALKASLDRDAQNLSHEIAELGQNGGARNHMADMESAAAKLSAQITHMKELAGKIATADEHVAFLQVEAEGKTKEIERILGSYTERFDNIEQRLTAHSAEAKRHNDSQPAPDSPGLARWNREAEEGNRRGAALESEQHALKEEYDQEAGRLKDAAEKTASEVADAGKKCEQLRVDLTTAMEEYAQARSNVQAQLAELRRKVFGIKGDAIEQLTGANLASQFAASEGSDGFRFHSGLRLDTGEGPRGVNELNPEGPPIPGAKVPLEPQKSAKVQELTSRESQQIKELNALYEERDRVARNPSAYQDASGILTRVVREITTKQSQIIMDEYERRTTGGSTRVDNTIILDHTRSQPSPK